MIAKIPIWKKYIYTSWFVFFIQNRIIFLFKTFPYIGVYTYMSIYINKIPSSQSYCFSSSRVWMWELDHKESEHWGTDAFELWCWRRLLRVPWTAMGSNLSILKEISPEYSLKRQILKLKLQYFGHLMQRTDSLEKTLMLGKIEGRRRRRWQKMRCLDHITDSMDMSLSKLQKMVGDRGAWWATVHGVSKSGYDWLSLTEGMHMCYVYSVMIIWSLYIGHIDKYTILVSGIITHR